MTEHSGNEGRDGGQDQALPPLNLFYQCMEMALAAVSGYAIMDVRRIAKRQMKLYQAKGDDVNNSHRNASDESKDVLTVEDCRDMLSLPMTAHHFFEFWERNAAVLEKTTLQAATQLNPLNVIKTRDFVKGLIQPFVAIKRAKHPNYSWENHLRQRTIHHVGDENEKSECVHHIITDQMKKRITCIFRGSATVKDWMQDFQLVMSSIPNPLLKYPTPDNNTASEENEEELPETIGIHLGFRDYLYGSNPTFRLPRHLPKLAMPSMQYVSLPKLPVSLPKMFHSSRSDSKGSTTTDEIISRKDELQALSVNESSGDDPRVDAATEESEVTEKTQLTKLETILEQLRVLKTQHPDFCIYLSGHSLGGALALIVAMEVAADPVLSSTSSGGESGNSKDHHVPVTCIAVAYPRVGGKEFSNIIEQLERRGKLHCLCIHNNGDVVPMVQSNPLKLISQDRGFMHVGFRALLLGKGRFDLGRANDSVPLIRHRPHNKLKKTNTDCSNDGRRGLMSPVWNVVFGRKDPSCSQEEDDDEDEGESERSSSADESPRLDPVAESILQARPSQDLQKTLLQRVNMHDYREYIHRLLDLHEIFEKMTMTELYELHRAQSSS